jgi:hypothetical protein
MHAQLTSYLLTDSSQIVCSNPETGPCTAGLYSYSEDAEATESTGSRQNNGLDVRWFSGQIEVPGGSSNQE